MIITRSLKSGTWKGPIDNSSPDDKTVIVDLSYDKDKKLFDNGLISRNEFNKIALLTPFEGILLDGHKIEGELITPGSVVYEIIDLSRLHNNANVLSLGSRFIKPERAIDLVKQWLSVEFEGK